MPVSVEHAKRKKACVEWLAYVDTCKSTLTLDGKPGGAKVDRKYTSQSMSLVSQDWISEDSLKPMRTLYCTHIDIQATHAHIWVQC